MTQVVTVRKAFLAGACAIMLSQVFTGVFNHYDLNDVKRKAFTAGRVSLARDIVESRCGFTDRSCDSLRAYLIDAEIDSILKARE